MIDDKASVVASVVRTGLFGFVSEDNALKTAHIRAKREDGFTIAELLIAVGVLVVLTLLFTQLLNSAANITSLGHKQMDADAQARGLLDRMAIDFGQMIKRSDVTYYLKGGTGGTQTGNDQIAFYSAIPGYYSTNTSTTQSPISLVAYRVNSSASNSAFNKLERVGKGLLWNGVSSQENPLIFWQPLPPPTNGDYATFGEIIGPRVFRFEYYYLRTDGTVSATPPGISSLAAVIVDVAAVDPKSKALLNDTQLATLNGASGQPPTLRDYGAGLTPGQLLTSWRAALDANTIGLPRPAISGIRLYERYFYLSPPSL
jgi:Tfp pilus assembly protein PilV